jgi:starch synthase
MELAQLIRTKRSQKPSAAETLDILYASSEVAPYSKTGGLADVAASLPKALGALGHRVSIITPLYKHLDPKALHLSRRLQPLQVPRLGKSRKKVEAAIWEGRTEGGVRIFFVEQEDFFDADGDLYGYGEGEFQENPARFAFFSRAVVEFALQYSVPVDVIHCNDWHTALAPIYRDHYYSDEMSDVACVLTIHNLAHQGRFDPDLMSETGLPKKYYKTSELRRGDAINYLQGGINHAEQVTTVSPTYAEEIQTDEGGFGLGEVLRDASDRLTGVLNGADYSVWSPEIDHYIKIQYDLDHLNGKRQNKAALQHHFGLPNRPTLPMLAKIGRFSAQKGMDLLIPAVETLLDGFEEERDSFQMVFLGDGDKKYVDEVRRLVKKFPRNVAAHIGYSEELAHEFQAAADLLLIPSLFEPCGLTQLYAMKYGTLPIVHATGGLVDTVIDPTRDGSEGDGTELSTGFIFEEFEEDALRKTIARATERYRHYRKWRPLIQNAMEQDFSWGNSASQYIEIYNKALGNDIEGDAE